MKSLLAFLIAIFLAANAWAAHGGSPGNTSLPYFFFRDVIGHSYADNYGWYGNHTVAASRAVFMGNGSPSRFPQSSIQWTVNPGDTPLLACCGLKTERAEMIQAFGGNPGEDVVAYGTTHYIAMSFYIPSGWQDSVASTTPPPADPIPWAIIAQLHADAVSEFSPPQSAWVLDCSTIPTHCSIRTCGGSASVASALGYCPQNVSSTLDLGAYVKGAWTDLVIEKVYEADGSGSTTVWTRTCPAGGTPGTCPGTLQQQQISATNTGGAFICYDNANPANVISCAGRPNIWENIDGSIIASYYTHGLYRNPQIFTQTYYSGPFVIAPTLQEAALAAFGQYP